MKGFILLLNLLLIVSGSSIDTNRRILHHPLLFTTSPPPPPQLPPPPPDQHHPFFPEIPNGKQHQNKTHTPPTQTPTDGSESDPVPPPAKKAEVGVSILVGMVTLSMLCALLLYVYRRCMMKADEDYTAADLQHVEDSTAPQLSSFLYIGTVQHSNNQTSEEDEEEETCRPEGSQGPPYRPSPELQPLPQLSRGPRNSTTGTILSSSSSSSSLSSEDNEASHDDDANFCTPHGSIANTDDGFSTPQSRRNSTGCSTSSVQYSDTRTFYKSRYRLNHVIKDGNVPSINFGAPPPAPPNLALLESVSTMTLSPPPSRIAPS